MIESTILWSLAYFKENSFSQNEGALKHVSPENICIKK